MGDEYSVAGAVLTAIYVEDDDGKGYTGFVEELLAVMANGRTLNETREQLQEQARLFLQANRDGMAHRMASYENVRRERFTIRLERDDRF